MSDLELRLARVERRLAYLTEYTDSLERALVALMPECSGDETCLHCHSTAELDSMQEEDEQAVGRAEA